MGRMISDETRLISSSRQITVSQAIERFYFYWYGKEIQIYVHPLAWHIGIPCSFSPESILVKFFWCKDTWRVDFRFNDRTFCAFFVFFSGSQKL